MSCGPGNRWPRCVCINRSRRVRHIVPLYGPTMPTGPSVRRKAALQRRIVAGTLGRDVPDSTLVAATPHTIRFDYQKSPFISCRSIGPADSTYGHEVAEMTLRGQEMRQIVHGEREEQRHRHPEQRDESDDERDDDRVPLGHEGRLEEPGVKHAIGKKAGTSVPIRCESFSEKQSARSTMSADRRRSGGSTISTTDRK